MIFLGFGCGRDLSVDVRELTGVVVGWRAENCIVIPSGVRGEFVRFCFVGMRSRSQC